jgi:diaminopimelate epimerase
MKIEFFKYHGAGNDFVIIDNRKYGFGKDNVSMVKMLCDRHFGVGADGLILLNNSENYHFEMIYFNSNGQEGSFCGNGSRCTVAFAGYLGIVQEAADFIAIDGPHHAEIIGKEWVRVHMNDIMKIETGENHYFLNSGSPHYVSFHDDIESMDVVTEGRKIRYSEKFQKEGTNVNFVQVEKNKLIVRTYERGVEDETLACGTGITASSVAAALKNNFLYSSYEIKARGGELKVSFKHNGNRFTDICMEGPAKQVFKGEIAI